MSSSRRSSQAEARRRLKERRALGVGGVDVSYVAKEEGDVYEEVDEAEYREIVERRREREDFVVDDDGIGYHDDGEEVYGGERADAEDDADRRRKRRRGTTALTEETLRRARRSVGSSEEKSGDRRNASMWSFVSKGAEATSSSRRGEEAAPSAELDSLLDDLEEDASAARRPRRPAPKRREDRRYGRVGGHDMYADRSARGPPRSRRRTPTRPPRREQEEPREENHDDAMTERRVQGNDQDNDEPMFESNADDDRVDDEPEKEKPEKEESASKNDGGATNETSKETAKIDDDEEQDESEKAPEAKEDAPAPAPRSVRNRFASSRSSSSRLSAPARAALEAQRKRDEREDEPAREDALAPLPSVPSIPSVPAASAAPAPPPAASHLFSRAVRGEGDDAHLDLYLMDASADERRGRVYLYGKVRVDDGEDGRPRYASCCAVVKRTVRNLFVLPKEGADPLDVHREMQDLLQPAVIPDQEGASWAGRSVRRRYAFDDPDVPREETAYYKIKYDARYGVPDERARDGGTHYRRVLNAGASALETFLLKRRLKGPSWVRLRRPTPSKAPTSWCATECDVESHKDAAPAPADADAGTPPATVASFRLVTTTNPTTHAAEIAALSAVYHPHVRLDGASDADGAAAQLTLLRPTGDRRLPADLPPWVRRMPNERALLSRFLAQLGSWDPDAIVGHGAYDRDVDVLLHRCRQLKVPLWSKLGRRRRVGTLSSADLSNKRKAVDRATDGRLLVDTSYSARELSPGQTNYTLTHLAKTLLDTERVDLEAADVPRYLATTEGATRLAARALEDARTVLRLALKLQVLPLTRQLTVIAGNQWRTTLRGNRADRNEWLLLHEFHALKYVTPEKRFFGKGKSRRGDDDDDGGGAKFSGGLVLEPKKGLYDSFVLLLDFNSLYPSIIQEYNLCFTTVDWAGHERREKARRDEETNSSDPVSLPPLPEDDAPRGVLPRVVRTLVERRRAVKKLMASVEDDASRQELNIRQLALKLTANSMYGCLGYANSRFLARPIAALVTSIGRDTLRRTADVATDTVGADVVYGDTDSIMINTGLRDQSDLEKVKALGNRVRREVNKLYKTLELEIDGVFRSMLLLKKKKYAAVTVTERPDGSLVYGTEYKGLDMVRRDWCRLSKNVGTFVLERVLDRDSDADEAVEKVHEHLRAVARDMREGRVPLDDYVVTKGLSKHPNDYPDAAAQPHVHVARRMLKADHAVCVNDHVPYVICAPGEENGVKESASTAERARHPDEMRRSAGALAPDVEWYLAQQILPPVTRLCEPVRGASPAMLAESLGLDKNKYASRPSAGAGGREEWYADEDLVAFAPATDRPDAERFEKVTKFELTCASCGQTHAFPGVLRLPSSSSSDNDPSATPPRDDDVRSGLDCVNPDCARPRLWGSADHAAFFARVSNALVLSRRRHCREYYEGVLVCDDPGCSLTTRQTSVLGDVCLVPGCAGRLRRTVTEEDVRDRLKYLDTLFDVDRACERAERFGSWTRKELSRRVSPADRETCHHLREVTRHFLNANAYNWVSPCLWRGVFGTGEATSHHVSQ